MSNKQRKSRLGELFRNTLGRGNQTGNAPASARGEGTGEAIGRAGTAVERTGEIVLKILPDVAKVVEKLPYLEGVAGILSSILQIRQVRRTFNGFIEQSLTFLLTLGDERYWEIYARSGRLCN